jgi:hypothetical protein
LDANLTNKDAKDAISGMESNRATGLDAIPDEARYELATKGGGTEVLVHCFFFFFLFFLFIIIFFIIFFFSFFFYWRYSPL